MSEPKSRKRTKAGIFVSSIGLQELASCFHLPSNQAAEALGVGLTIFKRLCRKFGLTRWPYRALKKHGKLLQQGREVSDTELQRIIQDYQVPLPWQPPTTAQLSPQQLMAAMQAAPARIAKGSASASDQPDSGDEEDAEEEQEQQRGADASVPLFGTGGLPLLAQLPLPPRGADGGSSSEVSGEQWLPGQSYGRLPPMPLPASSGQVPGISALLAAAGAPPQPLPAAVPVVRPQAHAAGAAPRSEQLHDSLLSALGLPPPAQQAQQPQLAGCLFPRAPAPAAPAAAPPRAAAGPDALAALLTAFASVPASDRQQVAALLQHLAEVLQQEAQTAAAAVLRRVPTAPPAAAEQPDSALSIVQELQQLCAPRPPPEPQPQQDASAEQLLASLLQLGGGGGDAPAAPAAVAPPAPAPTTSLSLPPALAAQLQQLAGVKTEAHG